MFCRSNSVTHHFLEALLATPIHRDTGNLQATDGIVVASSSYLSVVIRRKVPALAIPKHVVGGRLVAATSARSLDPGIGGSMIVLRSGGAASYSPQHRDSHYADASAYPWSPEKQVIGEDKREAGRHHVPIAPPAFAEVWLLGEGEQRRLLNLSVPRDRPK
jgi:hypothetical protein